jgi:hypothetical protein
MKRKKTLKRNLTYAFKELRKMGYIAEQDFWCCSTCAWSSIDSSNKKVVFYHSQDNDNLKENGTCYLSWSGNAKEIVDVLKKHGVGVKHDGDEEKRIFIDINIKE